MSTWELGFESPEEMYPDSPVEFQPDLWLVRRIEPETNAALKNINGWFERYIYSQPKKHRIYQTSNRMPNGPRLILNKMGLFRLNDWSIQYNTKGKDIRSLRNGQIRNKYRRGRQRVNFILIKETNEDLWQIKPYVIITPIRLPDGLPNEDEIENYKLLSNGELIDTRKRTPDHIKVRPFWQTLI